MRNKFKITLLICAVLSMLACSNQALEHFEQGVAYRDVGQWDNAIDAYTKAIEADPDFAVAYNNRGYAYTVKNNFDRAIADFDRAIDLDPGQAIAYFNRSRIYIANVRYEEAIVDLEKFIELSENPALIQTAQQLLQQLRVETAP